MISREIEVILIHSNSLILEAKFWDDPLGKSAEFYFDIRLYLLLIDCIYESIFCGTVTVMLFTF